MLNRMTMAMHRFASRSAEQTTASAATVRGITSHFFSTARHAVTVLGAIAIAVLVLMFFKPEFADRLQALSPFTPAVAANAPDAVVSQFLEMNGSTAVVIDSGAQPIIAQNGMLTTDIQQQRVTQWLSKRYRVANDATDMLVSSAYLTAKEINIDPLLILAVMAIESRFNPFAESPVGAQGLMQVMSKIHIEKFEEIGGPRSALNPAVNIKVGAMILKEYVKSGGSIEAGLKRYVGAAAMESDAGYGAKVLGEYDRLKAVAAGKRISAFATMAARAPRAETLPSPVEKSVDLIEQTQVEDKSAMLEVASASL